MALMERASAQDELLPMPRDDDPNFVQIMLLQVGDDLDTKKNDKIRSKHGQELDTNRHYLDSVFFD